jgi:methionyl-tRNA synthetase
MLTPFLPFSSQRLHKMLGYDDVIAPQPEVRQFSEDAGSHTVITGDYDAVDRWRPSELQPGRKLPAPEALFKRLDDLVEEDAASS